MDIPNQEARIRELAHTLWETRGRRSGHDLEDWLEAESQVTGIPRAASGPQRSTAKVDEGKQSFPASDPPASHLPDVPPRNSDDKWAAAEKARIVKSRKK